MIESWVYQSSLQSDTVNMVFYTYYFFFYLYCCKFIQCLYICIDISIYICIYILINVNFGEKGIKCTGLKLSS